jgi:hypothetical protein
MRKYIMGSPKKSGPRQFAGEEEALPLFEQRGFGPGKLLWEKTQVSRQMGFLSAIRRQTISPRNGQFGRSLHLRREGMSFRQKYFRT